ncbi:MAG: hypothetical protein NTZ05_22560, partial [Chloroflexi bacterium]|nr:hypothetical protein [Chloroflexota bacterium]
VQSVVQMVVFGAPSLAGLPIGARAAFIGPQPAPALGGVRCLALVGAVRLRVADLWRIGSGEATPTPPVQH